MSLLSSLSIKLPLSFKDNFSKIDFVIVFDGSPTIIIELITGYSLTVICNVLSIIDISISSKKFVEKSYKMISKPDIYYKNTLFNK